MTKIPMTILYYPRDETVGHRTGEELCVLREGGESESYVLRSGDGKWNAPDDVYLFIKERCAKPFYEADYAFCLENVLIEELGDKFADIKQKAIDLQGDLTKELKRAFIKPVQLSIGDTFTS